MVGPSFGAGQYGSSAGAPWLGVPASSVTAGYVHGPTAPWSPGATTSSTSSGLYTYNYNQAVYSTASRREGTPGAYASAGFGGTGLVGDGAGGGAGAGSYASDAFTHGHVGGVVSNLGTVVPGYAQWATLGHVAPPAPAQDPYGHAAGPAVGYAQDTGASARYGGADAAPAGAGGPGGPTAYGVHDTGPGAFNAPTLLEHSYASATPATSHGFEGHGAQIPGAHAGAWSGTSSLGGTFATTQGSHPSVPAQTAPQVGRGGECSRSLVPTSATVDDPCSPLPPSYPDPPPHGTPRTEGHVYALACP
jgi:hypothetical protein